MNIQIFFLLTIVVLLLEFVQLPEAYKYVRPWKFYRPKPRWHPFPRPPKYRFKRGPQKYRRSKWHPGRYAPHHTVDEQPYTIEIELPKHHDDWSGYDYSKKSNKRYHQYEYFDDDEDGETRTISAGKKKVRIKLVKGVKPKLRIKISREDNLPEHEVIDITNLTSLGAPANSVNFPYQTTPLPNYTTNWGSPYPRDLRGI